MLGNTNIDITDVYNKLNYEYTHYSYKNWQES